MNDKQTARLKKIEELVNNALGNFNCWITEYSVNDDPSEEETAFLLNLGNTSNSNKTHVVLSCHDEDGVLILHGEDFVPCDEQVFILSLFTWTWLSYDDDGQLIGGQ